MKKLNLKKKIEDNLEDIITVAMVCAGIGIIGATIVIARKNDAALTKALAEAYLNGDEVFNLGNNKFLIMATEAAA